MPLGAANEVGGWRPPGAANVVGCGPLAAANEPGGCRTLTRGAAAYDDPRWRLGFEGVTNIVGWLGGVTNVFG